jgi:hypothetical protein
VVSHPESEELARLLVVPEGEIFHICHRDQTLGGGGWLDFVCNQGKYLRPLILCEVKCFFSFCLTEELIQHVCELFSCEIKFVVGVLCVLGVNWTRQAKKV